MIQTVNVLGTEYRIETHKVSEDSTLKDNHFAGYCAEEEKLIVIADMTEKEYFKLSEKEREAYEKKTLRHELMHAFLNESGLSDCTSVMEMGWAKNEEMIDWFAIQAPKIFSLYRELDIL